MDALIPSTMREFDETAQAILDEPDTDRLLALRDQYRSDWLALIDVAKGQSDMPLDLKDRIISDTRVEDTTSVFVTDHYDRDEDAVYLQPPAKHDKVASTSGSDFGGPDRYSDKNVWSDIAEFDQYEDPPAAYNAALCADLVDWCEQSLLIHQLLDGGPDYGDEWRVLQTPLGPEYLPGWDHPEPSEPAERKSAPSYFELQAELLEFVHEDYEAAAHYASLIDAVRVDDRPRGKLRVDKFGAVTGDVFAGVPADGGAGITADPLPGSPTRPCAGLPAPVNHPHATMRRKIALAINTPLGCVGPHHAAFWGGEAIPRRDQGGPYADKRIAWLVRFFAGLDKPPANEVGCYRATVVESLVAWTIWLDRAHTNESLREQGVLDEGESMSDLPLRRPGAPRRQWVSTPEGEVIVAALGYEGTDLVGRTTGYVPAKPDRPTEGDSLGRLASDHWVGGFLR